MENGAGCHFPDVEGIRTFPHVQSESLDAWLKLHFILFILGFSALANVPLVRSCLDMTTQISPPRNGKAKASELQDILSAYEAELTCPMYV